ncbi:hypothetical protein Syun_006912 [Stephania yunnanensis]|uniref:Uncharacterized protein n=1 Tax=Stephania yunnanensis TaxID=152371 RepID=A0AAP0Q1V2_9MAGN
MATVAPGAAAARRANASSREEQRRGRSSGDNQQQRRQQGDATTVMTGSDAERQWRVFGSWMWTSGGAGALARQR